MCACAWFVLQKFHWIYIAKTINSFIRKSGKVPEHRFKYSSKYLSSNECKIFWQITKLELLNDLLNIFTNSLKLQLWVRRKIRVCFEIFTFPKWVNKNILYFTHHPETYRYYVLCFEYLAKYKWNFNYRSNFIKHVDFHSDTGQLIT